MRLREYFSQQAYICIEMIFMWHALIILLLQDTKTRKDRRPMKEGIFRKIA